MTIAQEIQNYADGLGDAYDAVNDMQGIIPQDKNMNNLDTAIRTIPQNLGPTYVAGNGIDITNDTISIDDTVVAELSDLPTKTSDLQNDGSDGTSTYVEADDLATVATSGLYSDLTGTPTIPTVNDATLTITQNGVSAGTFTANSSSDTTIALTDTTYSDFTGATSLDAGTAGLVPAPAAGDDTKFLAGNGLWTTVSQYSLPIASANDLGGIKVGNNLSINSSTGVLDATDTTYSDFGGATSSVAGSAGLVPAPTTSDPDKFLKGDGTWGTPTDTTYSAGTNVQISAGNVISATDTTYSDFTGATSSVAGTNGLVPAPAAGNEGKALLGNGTWGDPTAKLVEMAYGESNAWAKFIAAYNAGSIVYCRASSNANPASGAQTRKAFMAYVNNETNPTSVEFQYVRSVSSKTDSQQCDQVFVYTLTNTGGGTWSVASRNMAPKVAVDSSLTKTFTTGANATVTLKANNMTGATSSADGAAGYVTKPLIADKDKFLKGDGTWDTALTDKRLLRELVPDGTAIPASADLETATYLRVGKYVCSGTATAATLVNCPVSEAFNMEVFSPLTDIIDNETTAQWVYRIRRITDLYGNVWNQYVHVGSTPGVYTWGTWTKFSFSNIRMTNVDPGTGSPLAAQNYVAVYGNSDGLITASDIDMSTISRIMIQGTAGDTTYSSNTEIALPSTSVQLGTGLTRSGNKVSVGSGVSYVRISANVFMSYTSMAYGWFDIMKGSSVYNNVTAIANLNGSGFCSASVGGILMPVTSGDTIWLRNKDACKIRGYNSWLTVEQVG